MVILLKTEIFLLKGVFETMEEMTLFEMVENHINTEVDRLLGYEKQRIDRLEKENGKLREDKRKLKNNIEKQKEEIDDLKKAASIIPDLKKMINEENIGDFLDVIGIEFSGLYVHEVDKVPLWFRVLIQRYDDRDFVLKIFDLAEIKYPEWARKIKLPRDYGEKELEWFFEEKRKFSGRESVESFYRSLEEFGGETEAFLKGSWWGKGMPYVDLMTNPLLVSDNIFVKVLEALDNDSDEGRYRLYDLPSAQDVDTHVIMALADRLPKYESMSDYHYNFIKNHYETLNKLNPDYIGKYAEHISSGRFDELYYEYFPIEVQKEYFINSRDNSFMEKIRIIGGSDLTEEEKAELIAFVAKRNGGKK